MPPSSLTIVYPYPSSRVYDFDPPLDTTIDPHVLVRGCGTSSHVKDRELSWLSAHSPHSDDIEGQLHRRRQEHLRTPPWCVALLNKSELESEFVLCSSKSVRCPVALPEAHLPSVPSFPHTPNNPDLNPVSTRSTCIRCLRFVDDCKSPWRTTARNAAH